jgi:hypothetical protein
MAFTADELTNIANAALDFYEKSATHKQTVQDKPLLAALVAGQKFFPGGKGEISIPVQGAFASSDAAFFEGFTHNDTVGFVNPANILRAEYAWKEVHAGITMTVTELKHDGISIVDTNGASTSTHDKAELTRLTSLLENKMEDFSESWARAKNEMFWRDGTQDSKEVPGIKSLISHTPQTGTTGGLNRATYSWWRNRAFVGAGTNANGTSITHSESSQTLTKFLRKEVRQLNRYGKGRHKILCGSGFLEKLDNEVQAKGSYSLSGFSRKENTNIGLAEVSIPGLGTFEYDPTLDDLSEENFCYVIDLKAIRLMPMTGEDDKNHTPARPHDQFVLYKSKTWTGGLVARQLNTSAVYEAA